MCGSVKRKGGSMNLQIFRNEEFGEVRVEEINGDPWFVAADVCRALDLGNSRQAITRLDEDEKGVTLNDTLGGKQEMTIINEAGLYALVLSSRKPEAKAFKRWITHEVLPSIRRNGAYISGQEEMGEQELLARAYEVSQRILVEREKRIGRLEADNAELSVAVQIAKPKADYFDDLVDRNLLSSFTDTAKELGIKRKDFIGFLMDRGYIYRDKKGNLMPRDNEKAKDLFEVKQCSNQKTEWAGCQTLLTPKGVETFRLLCQGM